MQSMDYGKAFTYPQQDADWLKKLAIGSLLLLIPIAGQILMLGYMVEIIRRVITDNPQLLPEWSDFGGLAKQGVFAFVVGFVYALPLIVLFVCAYSPLVAVPMAASDDPDALNTMMSAASLIATCCFCVVFLLALAINIILPAAFGRLAVTGEIGSAFQFNEVLALVRAQPAVYLIVMLIVGVATFVLTSVGSIVCGIGLYFGWGYSMLVQAHLYGQAYRVASGVTSSGASPSAGIAPA